MLTKTKNLSLTKDNAKVVLVPPGNNNCLLDEFQVDSVLGKATLPFCSHEGHYSRPSTGKNWWQRKRRSYLSDIYLPCGSALSTTFDGKLQKDLVKLKNMIVE